MFIEQTDINGLYILIPELFYDHRGWFCESYSLREFQDKGISTTFVQDNRSYSEKMGTIRGLHFQIEPMAQTKLVSCLHGAIRDIVVDLRETSKTYKQWRAFELTDENKRSLLVPSGFAHGFITLAEHTEVMYKVDCFYSPQHERTIKYDDPTLSIDWILTDVILSDKDRNAPFLAELNINNKDVL